jgi:hypothetical protein
VAENPRTPTEALLRLASDKEDWVRDALAERPALPPEVLVQLARHASERHAERIAGNRALMESEAMTEEVLGLLLRHRASSVWERLASSSKLTAEMLATLAASDSFAVRLLVAAHPNASPKTLQELGEKERHADLLRSLARNPSSPPKLLRKLALHVADEISEEARKNPACPKVSWLRRWLAIQRGE